MNDQTPDLDVLLYGPANREHVVYRFGTIAMMCGKPTIVYDGAGRVVEITPHPELDTFEVEVVAERGASIAATKVVLGADEGRALVNALAQVGKAVIDIGCLIRNVMGTEHCINVFDNGTWSPEPLQGTACYVHHSEVTSRDARIAELDALAERLKAWEPVVMAAIAFRESVLSDTQEAYRFGCEVMDTIDALPKEHRP